MPNNETKWTRIRGVSVALTCAVVIAVCVVLWAMMLGAEKLLARG